MSEQKKQGFDKLPQELIDRIFEYYCEMRNFSIGYRKEYIDDERRRYRFTMRIMATSYTNASSWALNKKVYASAKRAYDIAPITLLVEHDYKKGYTALQVLSSNGPEYDALRNRVTVLRLSGGDGKTRIASSLTHAYNLIATKFPNLQQATVCYTSYRQVYESYQDYSTTSAWEALDPNKHRAGDYDGDFDFPVRMLGVRSLAAALKDRKKDNIKAYLQHSCIWNAKGRGYYCTQVCFHMLHVSPQKRRAHAS